MSSLETSLPGQLSTVSLLEALVVLNHSFLVARRIVVGHVDQLIFGNLALLLEEQMLEFLEPLGTGKFHQEAVLIKVDVERLHSQVELAEDSF